MCVYVCIGNRIRIEGCRIISEMLKSNSTLTKLELIGDEKEDKEKMKEISHLAERTLFKVNEHFFLIEKYFFFSPFFCF